MRFFLPRNLAESAETKFPPDPETESKMSEALAFQEMSSFTDPEADERARWERVEKEALTLCDPLARMIGHKIICGATDVSMGQLTRELSPNYENKLSLKTGLFVLRRSQNEKLARLLICDAADYRMPEPQKRRATPEEELRALKVEIRERAGDFGASLIEAAQRRARSGR
jgi:hypothetical protein